MSTRAPVSGKKSTKPRKPGTGIRAATVLAELAEPGSTTKVAVPPRKRSPRAKKQELRAPVIDSDAERIARFAEEYLVDLNASKAYVRAGFKVKSPKDGASIYMRRPEVVAKIKELKAERAARAEAEGGLTKDKVLRILNRMLDHDPRNMYNPDGTLKAPGEMDDAAAAVMISFETDELIDRGGKVYGRTRKVKTSARDTPLTLAMRHLGMLNDKLQLNLSGTVTVLDAARLSVLTDEELAQLEGIQAKLAAPLLPSSQ